MHDQQIAVQKPQQPQSLFATVESFESAQRMAVALSSSDIIPMSFRAKPANTLIALEYANRLGESPFVIMQNMHVINGKPGLKSEYLIHRINGSSKWPEGLQFKYEGEKKSDSRSCTAYVVDKNGTILEGTTIDIAMAKAEGWFGRTGSKWPTMPDQMLAYRAAAFFQRLHAPEVALGMQTAEEIIDIGYVDVTPGKEAAANLNSKLTNAAGTEGEKKTRVRKPADKPESEPVKTENKEPEKQEAEEIPFEEIKNPEETGIAPTIEAQDGNESQPPDESII